MVEVETCDITFDIQYTPFCPCCGGKIVIEEAGGV